MQFWLDRGVDGLRLDAVPYLIEREGTICENLDETHADPEGDPRERSTRATRTACCSPRRTSGRPTCGRISATATNATWRSTFPLMPRMFMAVRQEDRHPIVEILRQTPEIPENCQWAMFLRNHDELTLEMVTDEERDYMYQAYAADPQMRINVGIRRRLAPLMENSRRRIELMNSLLFSLPGTPVIYYGDEIGMGDNIYLGDRNGVRTPMQWTGDRNGGFSRADPARLYAPPIMDPVYGYQAINVEAQERSPFSLLNWMKRMIGLRKQHKVFGRGTIEFLSRAEPEGARLRRGAPGRNDAVRRQSVAHGAARRARSVAFQGHDAGGDARPHRVPAHRRAARTSSRSGRTRSTGSGSSRRRPRSRRARHPKPSTEVPQAPGTARRRGLGHAARRQRADADRARPALALPAAAALVRRQGARAARGALRRLGTAAARRAAAVPHARRRRFRSDGDRERYFLPLAMCPLGRRERTGGTGAARDPRAT